MNNYIYKYILLTVDKSEYRYEFQPNNPLVLGKTPEVGLKNLFLWYTYPNISEKYNNNQLTVSREGRTKKITIPTGMYEVEHLSDFINSQLLTEEESAKQFKVINLFVNEATFKCVVKILPGYDISIDFSEGQLHKLLGLEPKVYGGADEGGNDIINITRGVDRILIRCNVVDRDYQYKLSDTLYDILPYAQPGSAIQEKVDVVEFHKCKDRYIRHIDIKITDTSDNLLEFSEPISLKLVFRYQL